MHRAILLLSSSALAWSALGTAAPAAATVYRCTTPKGAVIYRDTPCPGEQRQQRLALPPVPTVVPPPAPADEPEEPAEPPAAAPTPAPAVAGAPLPVMYSCTRATDGKSYLSRNGDPAPYMVPLGILGAFPRSLSQVYGPTQGAAGISAPEANRGRVSPGLVANNYVWVRDGCRQMDAQETCRALEDAYRENSHKLDRAFKSERAPLEKRDAELQAQLTHC